MNRDVLSRRLASAFTTRPEVELALLFGSRARGDHQLSSDVDIAVIGEGVDTVGLAADLAHELGLEVGLDVDVVDLRGDPPIALLHAVVCEGVKIYERREGAYGRFLAHSLTDLERDLPAIRRMQRGFVTRVAERGLEDRG